MVKIVEITQSSDTVTCDKNGEATIQFNVNNLTPSVLRVGAKIILKDPSKQSWFTLEGKSEKMLNVNATDQFSVKVAAKGVEGVCKVQLLVFNVENADEEYTESEVVAVNVPKIDAPPTPPPNGFPKWIIWVLVGLFIAGLLGVIAYLATRDNGESQTFARIPDVIGKPFEQAKEDLEDMGFDKIETETQFDASKAKDTVLEQMPDAGSKEDTSNTEITLILANSEMTMPDVKDMTFQGAKERLLAKGFNKINKDPKFDLLKPAGTVLDQSPAAESNVNSNETEVTLTIADAGQEVPDLVGKSLADALQKLQAIGLGVGVVSSKPDKTKIQDTILIQKPVANKAVEKGAVVALTVVNPGKTSPVPTRVATKCANAVQGKIAWDYKKNKRWAASNVKRLCKGAENSIEPASCFNRVMHGRINWGGSTRWQWGNVLDLCEGSKNSTATISCFQKLIKRRVSWKTAISKCS